MLRMLKAAAIISWLGLTSLVGGYDDALAGVASAASAPAAAIGAISLKRVHWVHRCHCYRYWGRTSRRSSVPRSRYYQHFGSCWLWRATHWGIRRVWSCYYIY